VAIDIDNEVLYTVPAMGKAGWESAAFAGKQMEKTNKVVAVIGDDQVLQHLQCRPALHYTNLQVVYSDCY
jgi:hypothetical protein